MSVFGNYEKNEIYESILKYKANIPDRTNSEYIKEIMEAVSWGLSTILDEDFK